MLPQLRKVIQARKTRRKWSKAGPGTPSQQRWTNELYKKSMWVSTKRKTRRSTWKLKWRNTWAERMTCWRGSWKVTMNHSSTQLTPWRASLKAFSRGWQARFSQSPETNSWQERTWIQCWDSSPSNWWIKMLLRMLRLTSADRSSTTYSTNARRPLPLLKPRFGKLWRSLSKNC